MNTKNLAIIRQQFAQCVFIHKMHEKAADRLFDRSNNLRYLNVFLLGLVIVFMLLQIKYPDSLVFGSISIAISVFEIMYLFFQKEFPFEEKASEHKKIAYKYLTLRDIYKNFIADIQNDMENADIIAKRDSLQEQYSIISSLSPKTECSDYEKAQLSLLGKTNRDEEFTWSDTEIDRFLPLGLRSK
jgi:hypothetical protein